MIYPEKKIVIFIQVLSEKLFDLAPEDYSNFKELKVCFEGQVQVSFDVSSFKQQLSVFCQYRRAFFTGLSTI